jgi:hypothetical protein
MTETTTIDPVVDPPWVPPLAGSEVDPLVGSLDRLRATFRWKAGGLVADGLTVRIGASALTLGALLKHLAFVEDFSFATTLRGQSRLARRGRRSTGTGTRLAAALEEGGLEQPVGETSPNGSQTSLRRVLFDLVEEYGRHTGHADLIRESIDGLVGEDPPRGWRP